MGGADGAEEVGGVVGECCASGSKEAGTEGADASGDADVVG